MWKEVVVIVQIFIAWRLLNHNETLTIVAFKWFCDIGSFCDEASLMFCRFPKYACYLLKKHVAF